MVAGQTARMVCFDVPGQGGLVPADVDGATAPAAGSPNYVINIGADRLNMWRFKVDWAEPSTPTVTGPGAIKNAPFQEGCGNTPTPAARLRPPHTPPRH